LSSSSPTTLKLSPDLKRRIRAVVEGTGRSVHAFLVDAIEVETRRAEDRKQFVAAALEARDDFERTGLVVDAAELHAYVKARAAGRKATRPRPTRWRR
jgi:predicted transcriptional regulator